MDLEAKGWQWRHGYFDANFGTRALEQDFNYWTWGRYPISTGTQCFYDLELRNGETAMHAIDFNLAGEATEISTAPPIKRFRNSLWAVRRETRCDDNAAQTGSKPIGCTIYNRSVVETHLNGEKSIGVFEALDLHRFRNQIITAMLAVRVPRRPGWTLKIRSTLGLGDTQRGSTAPRHRPTTDKAQTQALRSKNIARTQ